LTAEAAALHTKTIMFATSSGVLNRCKSDDGRAVWLLHRALRVVHELVHQAPLLPRPPAVQPFNAEKLADVPLKVSSAIAVPPS